MEMVKSSRGKIIGKRILALTIFLVVLATIIVSLALPRALRKQDDSSFETEENTLANDEIFGGGAQSIRAGFIGGGTRLLSESPGEEPATAVKPKICYQVAYNAGGDRISIRFAAAISSLQADTATWTRAMYQSNGDKFDGLLSATQTVEVAYTGITHNGNVLYAADVADDNGDHPYHYFVVYSLLNIPVATYADYVLDASLELTHSTASVRSSVGAVQVNNSRHFTYEIGTPEYLTFTKTSRTFSVKGKDIADVSATDVVIPAYYVDSEGRYPVTQVGSGKNGFKDFKYLESIVIPETVTSIGDNAFTGCDLLETVQLSEGLLSIGNYAFQLCVALTDISIPNSVTSLGDFSFNECHSLPTITIGLGVTSLPSNAFSYCKVMTSISFNAKVFFLGSSCLAGCSKLVTINFPGTQGEWESIVKESSTSWKSSTGNFVVHCTDGDIPKADA